MGATAVYGWRLPDGPIAADGPDAFSDLASDIETTMSAPNWNSYTPAWASQGSQQPANPATKVGRYSVSNGWCDFLIYMSFGGTVNGGKGILSLGLPVAASSQVPEQTVRTKLWVPAVANWDGIGLISAGATVVYPLFTVANNNSTVGYWQNNDNTGAAGTGIPNMPSHWTCENGGNVVVTGRYLVV